MLHPRTDAALEKNGLGKDEDDRAAKPFKVEEMSCLCCTALAKLFDGCRFNWEDLEDPFFALSQPSRAEDAPAA